MQDLNVDHSSDVPTAFSAALVSGATRRNPSDRPCPLLRQRQLGPSSLSGGLEAELQYRQSGAFDAITFAAFARGWVDNYASHLRDGSHFSVGVSARGALTDRLGLSGELVRNERHAQSEVWDLID